MVAGQAKAYDQINELQKKLSDAWVHYWKLYSGLHTWQFWCLITLLVVPLIILYFRIDRKKAIQIGFFGFCVHTWLSKLDEMAIANGLWNYPYTEIPYLTSSFVLDASFTPVAFMLVYQWTLNLNRRYYLYATGLSFFLAFVFRPALSTFELFSVKKTVYYGILFAIYVVVLVISKWTTDLFVHFQREGNVSPSGTRSKDIRQTSTKAIVKRKPMLGRRFTIKRT